MRDIDNPDQRSTFVRFFNSFRKKKSNPPIRSVRNAELKKLSPKELRGRVLDGDERITSLEREVQRLQRELNAQTNSAEEKNQIIQYIQHIISQTKENTNVSNFYGDNIQTGRNSVMKIKNSTTPKEIQEMMTSFSSTIECLEKECEKKEEMLEKLLACITNEDNKYILQQLRDLPPFILNRFLNYDMVNRAVECIKPCEFPSSITAENLPDDAKPLLCWIYQKYEAMPKDSRRFPWDEDDHFLNPEGCHLKDTCSQWLVAWIKKSCDCSPLHLIEILTNCN